MLSRGLAVNRRRLCDRNGVRNRPSGNKTHTLHRNHHGLRRRMHKPICRRLSLCIRSSAASHLSEAISQPSHGSQALPRVGGLTPIWTRLVDASKRFLACTRRGGAHLTRRLLEACCGGSMRWRHRHGKGLRLGPKSWGRNKGGRGRRGAGESCPIKTSRFYVPRTGRVRGACLGRWSRAG